MKKPLRERSLSGTVFLAIVTGELVLSLVLGVTLGVFSALSGAQQRQVAIRQISSTIAAGLMPMIADQQIDHVEAQLFSILESADVSDVLAVHVRDGSGATIASKGEIDEDAVRSGRDSKTPLDVLLREQVVVEPVIVDGLQVATVAVRFAAPGLGILKTPTLASVLVLLAALAITIPWTAWRLRTQLRDPLDALGAFAWDIASGDLDAEPPEVGQGEIRQLQEILSEMARQLRERGERLRGSLRELEAAYESLTEAKDSIERLSAVKSNFVAVAAHEIRSPLTTISMYAELLDSGELGEVGARGQEAVAAISAATRRLTTIVADLMDSALLERGLLHVRFGHVGLEPLVEAAVRDAEPRARRKSLQIELVGGIPDLVFPGDEVRLRQVLDNLLSNALKYSPPGSRIRVTARQDGGWVVVEVADEGEGIAPDVHEQVFSLFGRVDSNDTREHAGLGLGLAISARIVQAHGGVIDYRPNEAGRGTVFFVRLPIEPGDNATMHRDIKVAETGA